MVLKGRNGYDMKQTPVPHSGFLAGLLYWSYFAIRALSVITCVIEDFNQLIEMIVEVCQFTGNTLDLSVPVTLMVKLLYPFSRPVDIGAVIQELLSIHQNKHEVSFCCHCTEVLQWMNGYKMYKYNSLVSVTHPVTPSLTIR